MSVFRKATKLQARLRLALIGPSGSGKTYTALRVGVALGSRVALIDTERGSAEKYAGLFAFDTMHLHSFHPERYIEAIKAAEAEGYDVLVIDSLSHAWEGKDGAQELHDRAVKRSRAGNDWAAWREVTPIHNALVDAILQSSCHVIATMRAKTDWVLEERNGKQVPVKVGLKMIQRPGLDYEFDVVGDITAEHELMISKTRCPVLAEGVIRKPGEEFAATLKEWLTDGAEPAPVDAVVVDEQKQIAAAATATQPVNGDSLVISELQRKRLWTIAKGKGWTEELLRAWLLTMAIVHTRDIKRSQYEDICTSLGDGPPADKAGLLARAAELQADMAEQQASPALQPPVAPETTGRVDPELGW